MGSLKKDGGKNADVGPYAGLTDLVKPGSKEWKNWKNKANFNISAIVGCSPNDVHRYALPAGDPQRLEIDPADDKTLMKTREHHAALNLALQDQPLLLQDISVPWASWSIFATLAVLAAKFGTLDDAGRSETIWGLAEVKWDPKKVEINLNEIENTVVNDLGNEITPTDLKLMSARLILPKNDLVELDKKMKFGAGDQAAKYQSYRSEVVEKYKSLNKKGVREDERASVFSVGPAQQVGSSGDFSDGVDPRTAKLIAKQQNTINNQAAQINNLQGKSWKGQGKGGSHGGYSAGGGFGYAPKFWPKGKGKHAAAPYQPYSPPPQKGKGKGKGKPDCKFCYVMNLMHPQHVPVGQCKFDVYRNPTGTDAPTRNYITEALKRGDHKR